MEVDFLCAWVLRTVIKALFGEKTEMEWNQDLNPGGLDMELQS